ncbi:uncharacterized protein L3040_004019 [Drepanopeziza brunnea f. sp. 'multigermtubi']|uniref:Uncharacterized protein n=1 Tax=Marssonina brunnea f. sp. multigermtubi (strain MB_m1) TaxID=1072389 RepID=K1X4X9_MARBU|nr:uncharacterized protein MBM_06341 [Drepanopeziza brunnea f. sp. 'multigermtubi' MB_m1]EKD15713.1 hypothetical protein MBM_06341 [Drepanopeziza brunnea f. sp. 'multigermtubi' MB_m1]KAJ5046794.1 hypothetical protein L3040_004019 [Drepanopeziza brunnea f. sp. 'multigermtubi']
MPLRHIIAERVAEVLEKKTTTKTKTEGEGEMHRPAARRGRRGNDSDAPSLTEWLVRAAIPVVGKAVRDAIGRHQEGPREGLKFYDDDDENGSGDGDGDGDGDGAQADRFRESHRQRQRQRRLRRRRGRRSSPFGYTQDAALGRHGYAGREPHVSYGGGLEADWEGYIGDRKHGSDGGGGSGAGAGVGVLDHGALQGGDQRREQLKRKHRSREERRGKKNRNVEDRDDGERYYGRRLREEVVHVFEEGAWELGPSYFMIDA